MSLRAPLTVISALRDQVLTIVSFPLKETALKCYQHKEATSEEKDF